MYRRRCGLLALALIACVVASAVAQPDVTTVAGTIQEVDTTTGRFMLRAADGTLTELHTSAAFLTTLQPGDAVEVLMAGPNALIIRTPSEPSPPVLEEPQPQSSPDTRDEPHPRPPSDAQRHGD